MANVTRSRFCGALGGTLALMLLLIASRANADAGWFEAGDLQLRMDLQLLNDAGVIRYPLNQWPIPRAAIADALADSDTHSAGNAAVRAALDRVRLRFVQPQTGVSFAAAASLGQAGLWRDFGTSAREDGELGVSTSYAGERVSAGINAALVVHPADGQELRADGSHLTLQLGNWLFSAHTLDRWWGPGHQGSLILSSNARPMPTAMIERAVAKPFESPWLSWLGPWRFSFAISRMEGHRQDIDRPLFMAWRVEVMPFRDIELGFSRTAQFCGAQLACDLDSFGNMLAGNDNVGIDSRPEDEPGNQMAGFDIRWNSPIGTGPYAIYSQMIGEDESSYLPAKYISMFGAEAWKPMSSGSILQIYAEYAATTCSAHTDRGPYYGCAYNQGRFDIEGYRYRGRVLGYPSDRDSENWSLGLNLASAGSTWTATARTSRLNRDDFDDVSNSVATVPTDYEAVELGWRGKLLGEHVSMNLGVQRLEPEGGERSIDLFGFVSWRHEFP